MKFFLCVVGMVMIVEGLPYFAFPEKMKDIIYAVTQLPENALRRFGAVLMLLGLGVVYFGNNLN
ncbi:MAG: DUF2065 domain-containing protein [Desulfamplus sp.]|nr:DUF2065 domain-containing protein [Desulfamplus sp.]MBF0209602.1 DUF2065 domain-containing protein [Desulfamplus sp.]MBF0241795.1 DUF2065 domain-containing protein [Desulfamplus sp.]